MSKAVKAFFDDVASCYDNVLPFFSEFGKAVAGALPAPTPGARALLSPGGLFAFTTPGRVPDGFEFSDIAHDLFGEFAQYVAPGRILGAGFGQMAALAAGFTHLEETDIRVELPVPHAETFWAWSQTHGSRHLLDELDEAHRAELRRRLMTDLEARDRLVLCRASPAVARWARSPRPMGRVCPAPA